MIVLDASVVVESLVARGPAGSWASEQIARADSLHAPHLIDSEVVSALRQLVLAGGILAREGAQALQDFGDLAMRRYPATALLDRMWELRASLTAYDATYVALAEALELPLVTADRRLARARGHRAEVIALPD